MILWRCLLLSVELSNFGGAFRSDVLMFVSFFLSKQCCHGFCTTMSYSATQSVCTVCSYCNLSVSTVFSFNRWSQGNDDHMSTNKKLVNKSRHFQQSALPIWNTFFQVILITNWSGSKLLDLVVWERNLLKPWFQILLSSFQFPR